MENDARSREGVALGCSHIATVDSACVRSVLPLELLHFLCKGPNQHSVTERSCTMLHNGKFLHINGLIQKGLQAAGAIRSRK